MSAILMPALVLKSLIQKRNLKRFKSNKLIYFNNIFNE